MLFQNRHVNFRKTGSPDFRLTVRRVIVFGALILGFGILFLQPGIVSPAQKDTNPIPDLNSAEAKSQGVPFQMQQGYLGNRSSPAYWSESPLAREEVRALLTNLSSDGNADVLIQAPTSVVPLLIDALDDTDPAVRRGAAQVLGLRREPEAHNSLFFATFDADSTVRASAILALGKLNALLTIPRMERLRILDSEQEVRDAANESLEKLYNQVAIELDVATPTLRAMAIAPANGRVYAATIHHLYAPRDLGWGRISKFPDRATALATVEDGQLIYLGTDATGMYKSRDGGIHWESISTGLPTGSPFVITALAINPENVCELFVTLGVHEAGRVVPLVPVGIYRSVDGGDTWSPLVQWNIEHITTRLVVDPSPPRSLSGLNQTGVWKYSLRSAPAPDQENSAGDCQK